jgi:hypothetical protein
VLLAAAGDDRLEVAARQLAAVLVVVVAAVGEQPVGSRPRAPALTGDDPMASLLAFRGRGQTLSDRESEKGRSRTRQGSVSTPHAPVCVPRFPGSILPALGIRATTGRPYPGERRFRQAEKVGAAARVTPSRSLEPYSQGAGTRRSRGTRTCATFGSVRLQRQGPGVRAEALRSESPQARPQLECWAWVLPTRPAGWRAGWAGARGRLEA